MLPTLMEEKRWRERKRKRKKRRRNKRERGKEKNIYNQSKYFCDGVIEMKESKKDKINK